MEARTVRMLDILSGWMDGWFEGVRYRYRYQIRSDQIVLMCLYISAHVYPFVPIASVGAP